MQNRQPLSPAKKTLPALVAAVSMSIFISLAVLAFGINALFNQNVSVAQAAGQSDPAVATNTTTIQDLQATISQYQERENQYKTELQQAADQINQANQQNLQYQQLFQALQRAGVIQITSDGQVFISRSPGFSPGFDDGN